MIESDDIDHNNDDNNAEKSDDIDADISETCQLLDTFKLCSRWRLNYHCLDEAIQVFILTLKKNIKQ